MRILNAPKPNLDDGIQEEIEVLIDEHERLIQAIRGETSRRSSSGDGLDLRYTEAPMQEIVDHDAFADIKSESPEENIFVCKRTKEAVTTNKTKKSYISRASKTVVRSTKPRRDERKASPPPPLSQATTFDTEPTFMSEDEEHDRDSYSTTSREADIEVILIPQTRDFSRMSIPDIATIIEEQQQRWEQIKGAEIQCEQDEIDQGLQKLHDGSESGTDYLGESHNESFDWLESEVDHAEIVTKTASEIGWETKNTDGSGYSIPAGDRKGIRTAAVTYSTKVIVEEGTTPKKNQLPLEKISSLPLPQEKSLVFLCEGDSAVQVEEEEESPPLTIRKSITCDKDSILNIPSIEKERAGPSSLVEDSFVGCRSENVDIMEVVEDEEEPPPLIIQRSISSVEESELTIPFKNIVDSSSFLSLEEKRSHDLKNESVSVSEEDVMVKEEEAQHLTVQNTILLEKDTKLYNPCIGSGDKILFPSRVDKQSDDLGREDVDDTSPVHEQSDNFKREDIVDTIKAEETELTCLAAQNSILLQEGKESDSSFTKEVAELMSSPLVDEKSLFLGDDCIVASEEDIEVTSLPDQVAVVLEQEKELPVIPIVSDQFLFDPEKRLSTSQQLLFEYHPQALALEPIDLDEVHDHDCIVTIEEEEEEIEVTSSPDQNPTRLEEEEIEIQANLTGSNQFPCNPEEDRLSTSQQMLFEDHSQARTLGPIDLDEVHDHVEISIALLNDSVPSCDVPENKECIPMTLSLTPPNDPDPDSSVNREIESFPETVHLIPPASSSLTKPHPVELSVSSIVSSSKFFMTNSSSVSSLSMSDRRYRRHSMKRRSSGVHGDFARIKYAVLMAMICVVAGIGSIAHWFDLPIDSPSNKFQIGLGANSLPKLVADEELINPQHKAKEKNRKGVIDLEEFHFLF